MEPPQPIPFPPDSQEPVNPFYWTQALESMHYPGPYGELLLTSFTQHWGSKDLSAMLRALQEAPSFPVDLNALYPDVLEERLFALFGIGYSGNTSLREVLVPFLYGSHLYEQWAAALGLGYLKDVRAVPVLLRLLETNLPPDMRFVRPDIPEWRIEWWRSAIPSTLARAWRNTAEAQTIAPAFHRALKRITALISGNDSAATEQLHGLHASSHEALVEHWQACCVLIVFALGLLGDFTTLEDVPIAEDKRQLWMVYQILGSLHDRYPNLHIGTWSERPGLQDDVAQRLQRTFGLSTAQQADVLARFERECLTNFRIVPSALVEGWD